MRNRLTTLRPRLASLADWLRVASGTIPWSSLRSGGFCLTALVASAALAGCRQDMHDTPRYEVYEASASFADGRASRNPPAGTVARGQLRDDDHFYTGKVDGETLKTLLLSSM